VERRATVVLRVAVQAEKITASFGKSQPLALARNDPRLLGKTDHVIVRGDF